MKPRILFISATHGDEPIGVRVLRDLAKTETSFDWLIGNPLAHRQGTREFEGDLNRSAPGDLSSPQYAKRRAAEILATAARYDWCLDLHGTTACCGIFIIITKLTRDNLRLAVRLGIPRIVFWPSIRPELEGPLSEFFPCGIEIECGPKDMSAIERQLKETLRSFLCQRDLVYPDSIVRDRLNRCELYVVDGALTQPVPGLEDFSEVEIDGNIRYPLLVGQYQKQGMACYTMHRCTRDDWWT